MEEIKDHSYTSIQSLLAYTAMTCNASPVASKERYKSWVDSLSCTTFCNKVRLLSRASDKPVMGVFMVFWSDGFDPTTSMKRNRRSVWIMTVTFFCYDIETYELYLVEPCLVAIGPGKGAAESKEDHSCIFEKLRLDLDKVNNREDGSPIPLTFSSRAHEGRLCDFYICKEIHFSGGYKN